MTWLRRLVRGAILGFLFLFLVFPEGASANLGKVFLPLLNNNYSFSPPAPSDQKIVNPGFEQGTVGWTYFVDVGNPILTKTLAHSGYWSAELGAYYAPSDSDPFAYVRRAYIQQKIYVPLNGSVLKYWEYIVTDETDCLTNFGDFVTVYINNTAILRTSICSPSGVQTIPWRPSQIDLDSYAGKWVFFRLEYTSDNTLPSDYYVDDFSFIPQP